jgi:hypothetical protein
MEDGEGLGMEVPEHGVGLPSPHEPENRGVDSTNEESHGATGTKTAGVDISRKKTKVGAEGGGLPKDSGNQGGRDWPSGRAENCAQGSGQRGVVGAKVGDPPKQGGSGTGHRMATSAMTNNFPPVAVLLGVKGKRHMGGLVKQREGSLEGVKVVSAT